MQACILATNAIARETACDAILSLSPLHGYFLAVAALLIACRFIARAI